MKKIKSKEICQAKAKISSVDEIEKLKVLNEQKKMHVNLLTKANSYI